MDHYVAPHIDNHRPLCITCYRTDCEHLRPPEPASGDIAWYRHWEISFDWDAAFWSKEGWVAYKGGCDLDAPRVSATTYIECLDAIDEEEA